MQKHKHKHKHTAYRLMNIKFALSEVLDRHVASSDRPQLLPHCLALTSRTSTSTDPQHTVPDTSQTKETTNAIVARQRVMVHVCV